MRGGRWSSARAVVAVAVAVVASVAGALPPPLASAAVTPGIGQPVVAPPVPGTDTRVEVPVAGADGGPVELRVIVGFAAPATVALRDDGMHGDSVPGDGTFTGAIPAQPAGTLVRYQVVAGSAVWPVPEGNRRHDGFVVARPSVATALPLLDWYLAPTDEQWLVDNRGDKTYVPAVLVVDGVVLDGVQVRNQGGATSALSPKPNFKFKLPGQRQIGPPLFDDPVDEFVADADHEDPTYSIGSEAQHLFEAAGVPVRSTGVARVERNGTFYGVYQLYEELDGTWVDRLGFPVGSIYESENDVGGLLVTEGSAAALEQRWSQNAGDGSYHDLEALVAQVDGRAGPARARAVVDAFDVPRLVDLLAMAALLQHTDTGQTNLTLVSDQRDGRWRVVPNDLDLVLGLRGRTRLHGVLPLPMLGTTSAILGDGTLAPLVGRRIRTLYDRYFAGSEVHDRVAARVDSMRADVAEDRARWPLALPSLDQGVADLADHLAHLRQQIDGATGIGVVPAAQDPTAAARVSEIRAGGDAGDFVELANPHTEVALDISGWRLDGAASAELPGGSVLPAGGRLVVPVDAGLVAQRQEGIVVAGRLTAPLPTGGGTLVLQDPEGASRDAVAWGAGGAWPSPGTSGRSIEARTLGEGRAAPGGWALSPLAGGTPGHAGASISGLQVDAWTGTLDVRPGDALPVRIAVSNPGTVAATGVATQGPGTSCDATLGTLPASTTRVVWCQLARADLGVPAGRAAFGALAITVSSDQQPTGATSTPWVLASVPMDVAPSVAVTSARLGDGTLEVGHRLERHGEAEVLGPVRVEQQFVPLGGRPVSSEQVAAMPPIPAAPTTTATPLGVEGLVRWTVRSSAGPVWTSTFTPPLTTRATSTWPFASPSSLVGRWYLDLVGRPANANDKTWWTTYLAGGGDPADVALSLLAAPRWQADVAPLVRLYLAHFGRAPDDAGLRYWTDRRRAGTTLARISDQFVGSPEFARRYAGLDSRGFVDAAYRNVFGRAPDPDGLAYWAARVDRGQPRGSVVLAFAESSEGTRRAAPEVDSLVAWFALHGTSPTAAWHARAAGWLAGGGDLGTVVESVRSTEAYAAVIAR